MSVQAQIPKKNEATWIDKGSIKHPQLFFFSGNKEEATVLVRSVQSAQGRKTFTTGSHKSTVWDLSLEKSVS